MIGLPGGLAPAKPVMRQKNPQFALLLNSTIDEVNMEGTSLDEALQFISFYARAPRFAPEGPNFISTVKTNKTITLNLRKVRGIDILRYVTEQTGTNFRVDQNVISIIEGKR